MQKSSVARPITNLLLTSAVIPKSKKKKKSVVNPKPKKPKKPKQTTKPKMKPTIPEPIV